MAFPKLSSVSWLNPLSKGRRQRRKGRKEAKEGDARVEERPVSPESTLDEEAQQDHQSTHPHRSPKPAPARAAPPETVPPELAEHAAAELQGHGGASDPPCELPAEEVPSEFLERNRAPDSVSRRPAAGVPMLDIFSPAGALDGLSMNPSLFAPPATAPAPVAPPPAAAAVAGPVQAPAPSQVNVPHSSPLQALIRSSQKQLDWLSVHLLNPDRKLAPVAVADLLGIDEWKTKTVVGLQTAIESETLYLRHLEESIDKVVMGQMGSLGCDALSVEHLANVTAHLKTAKTYRAMISATIVAWLMDELADDVSDIHSTYDENRVDCTRPTSPASPARPQGSGEKPAKKGIMARWIPAMFHQTPAAEERPSSSSQHSSTAATLGRSSDYESGDSASSGKSSSTSSREEEARRLVRERDYALAYLVVILNGLPKIVVGRLAGSAFVGAGGFLTSSGDLSRWAFELQVALVREFLQLGAVAAVPELAEACSQCLGRRRDLIRRDNRKQIQTMEGQLLELNTQDWIANKFGSQRGNTFNQDGNRKELVSRSDDASQLDGYFSEWASSDSLRPYLLSKARENIKHLCSRRISPYSNSAEAVENGKNEEPKIAYALWSFDAAESLCRLRDGFEQKVKVARYLAQARPSSQPKQKKPDNFFKAKL